MSLKQFGAAVKKIAGDRAYLVQIDSCARLQSDGSGMTVVTYYGWIDRDGHRACSDISAESVLAWLSKP